MNIGLIDVDGHNFPNYALMKISAWHKDHGDNVEWVDPMFGRYDKVYASKIFTFSKDYDFSNLHCEIVKGGTGYDIKSKIEETEFEDGDIIAFGNLGFPPIMAIFKGYWKNDINDPGLIYHVCLHMGTVDYYNGVLCNSDNLRLATEEEKQKLFDALKKDGKQWNTERKCIEELPRNTHEFKPFDKVLVRNGYIDTWGADIFLEYSNLEFQFRCFRCVWRQCIPYEGNEILLGTSNKPINL